MRPGLSIIVPVLNDAQALRSLLTRLDEPLFMSGAKGAEVVVVDGGSLDDGASVAVASGATLVRSPPGRGRQLNAGLQVARGDLIWMLHADSVPAGETLMWMARYRQIGWGRFDIAFDDAGPKMRLVAALMNARSRLTGICTGDQGIFVHRRLLERIGGIPEQPLMEDIELCSRLAHLARPVCPAATIQTSARRWRENGWLATVLQMWRLRLRYWFGATADVLASDYHGRQR